MKSPKIGVYKLDSIPDSQKPSQINEHESFSSYLQINVSREQACLQAEASLFASHYTYEGLKLPLVHWLVYQLY